MTAVTLSNLEVTRFFLAIVVLLTLAHLFGYLFQRFHLPRVLGEIFGGFLVGPTGLGFFLPSVQSWLFNAFEAEGKLIAAVYWLGLILLMFISGFEIQRSFDQDDKRIVLGVLLGSTLIPFLAGWMAPSLYDFSPFLGTQRHELAFRIILAIAAAVTSIPVISKIFLDLNILHTRFAKIVLATATIHDVILWGALAVATGLIGSQSAGFSDLALHLLVVLVFFVLTLFAVPKLIRYANALRINVFIKSSLTGYVLAICLVYSALASALNVNIVFGALLAGVIIGQMPEEEFGPVKKHIQEISRAFFIPIYFAVVGIKLDLIRHFTPLFFVGFLTITTLIQVGGTMVASKLAGVDWKSSFNLGVAMNARGGPGIVLATIAFDMGIINQAFFLVLVLTALITSLAAGSWFHHLLSTGRELLETPSPLLLRKRGVES